MSIADCLDTILYENEILDAILATAKIHWENGLLTPGDQDSRDRLYLMINALYSHADSAEFRNGGDHAEVTRENLELAKAKIIEKLSGNGYRKYFQPLSADEKIEQIERAVNGLNLIKLDGTELQRDEIERFITNEGIEFPRGLRPKTELN